MSENTAVGEFMHGHIKNLQHIGNIGMEDTEPSSQLSEAITV